ncbi:MAG: hypothetical protein U1E65_33405 [Myxococcota bacterium]
MGGGKYAALWQAALGLIGLMMAIRQYRRRSRLPRDGDKFGRKKKPAEPPKPPPPDQAAP